MWVLCEDVQGAQMWWPIEIVAQGLVDPLVEEVNGVEYVPLTYNWDVAPDRWWLPT